MRTVGVDDVDEVGRIARDRHAHRTEQFPELHAPVAHFLTRETRAVEGEVDVARLVGTVDRLVPIAGDGAEAVVGDLKHLPTLARHPRHRDAVEVEGGLAAADLEGDATQALPLGLPVAEQPRLHGAARDVEVAPASLLHVAENRARADEAVLVGLIEVDGQAALVVGALDLEVEGQCVIRAGAFGQRVADAPEARPAGTDVHRALEREAEAVVRGDDVPARVEDAGVTEAAEAHEENEFVEAVLAGLSRNRQHEGEQDCVGDDHGQASCPSRAARIRSHTSRMAPSPPRRCVTKSAAARAHG